MTNGMTDAMTGDAHRFSVAPMMARTDRHCRMFLRRISARALLHTEMLTAAAIVHGNRDRLLGFDAAEHPVSCQIGGSDPDQLAEVTRIVAAYGYDEINLNVGCPSARVQSGEIGACLMRRPERVRDALAAMIGAAGPHMRVSIKTRIGVDGMDRYADLVRFVETVAKSGCDTFIIHARKAWLNGLSPRQNREIPPLRHDRVYRLKADFPRLRIILNGGITSLAAAQTCLAHGVDGVMVGRAAYDNPWLLAGVDREIFAQQDARLPDRRAIAARMMAYADAQVRDGVPLHRITRHMMGLFAGQPGARIWRRHLTTHAVQADAGGEVIRQALDQLPADADMDRDMNPRTPPGSSAAAPPKTAPATVSAPVTATHPQAAQESTIAL